MRTTAKLLMLFSFWMLLLAAISANNPDSSDRLATVPEPTEISDTHIAEWEPPPTVRAVPVLPATLISFDTPNLDRYRVQIAPRVITHAPLATRFAQPTPGPVAVVEPTAALEPVTVAEPTAAPLPVPTQQPGTSTGECSLTPPAWLYDDSGQLMADGRRLADIRVLIWVHGQQHWCDGDNWVRISHCEGLNAAAQWRVDYVRSWADAGVMQINQIHGRSGGIIAGQWPGAVQNVAGNLEAARRLREADRSVGGSGYGPWRMSVHCHGLR